MEFTYSAEDRQFKIIVLYEGDRTPEASISEMSEIFSLKKSMSTQLYEEQMQRKGKLAMKVIGDDPSRLSLVYSLLNHLRFGKYDIPSVTETSDFFGMLILKTICFPTQGQQSQ